MPAARDGMHRETYTVALPPGAPPGSYELKLKLHANDQNRDVLLALDPALLDQENYYSIATLHVTEE